MLVRLPRLLPLGWGVVLGVLPLSAECGLPASPDFEQELVLHLAFEGNPLDASGRGNHGTLSGTPAFVPGRIGQAIELNDSGESISLGTPADLLFGATTDFSVSFWFRGSRWDENPGATIVGSFHPSSDSPGWAISLGQDGCSYAWVFRTHLGETHSVPVGGYLGDGNWRHAAVVHDRDAEARFYMDGRLINTEPTRVLNATGSIDSESPLRIGRDSSMDGGPPLNARLDDLAIWRRALSDEEIHAVFAAGVNARSFKAFNPLHDVLKAFPEAEGAGSIETTGGRSGSVYIVTNLNRSGPGSLADAVSQPNRIIVFEVSGKIDLQSTETNKVRLSLRRPNITIAGQTAPGEGICITQGRFFVDEDNMIIRHMRFRHGVEIPYDHEDAMGSREDTTYGVYDHLSASFGTDESMSIMTMRSTTQWCLVAETQDRPIPFHYETPIRWSPHAYGTLWGNYEQGGRVSWHHGLFAHLRGRLIRIHTDLINEPVPVYDYRCNVGYNWIKEANWTEDTGVAVGNWVNGYYKQGVNTERWEFWTFRGNTRNKVFMEGFVLPRVPNWTANNWNGVYFADGNTVANSRSLVQYPTYPVTTEPTLEAYQKVLDHVGCTLPSRDQIDLRVVREVEAGTGKVLVYMTDLPPEDYNIQYLSIPPHLDVDRDGMPNYWETQFGLNPIVASDNFSDLDGDGYKNIEEYINNTNAVSDGRPMVNIRATISRGREDGRVPGELRVKRDRVSEEPLAVTYSIGGTAAAGVDYQPLSGVVTIPAGLIEAAIPVTPRADLALEGLETVVVTLDVSDEYYVGCPRTALVGIYNGEEGPAPSGLRAR